VDVTSGRTTRIASIALATAVAALLVASDLAAGKRPRGVVEDCSGISGFGANLGDFSLRRNLVVGPLAILRAGGTLAYADAVGGNKLFVLVKGGHRVTVELPRRTRRGAGLVFGPYPDGEVSLRDARRVACRRGQAADRDLDSWPVSGWVGFLLATSPRCVPLRVWVDDEATPRRAVVRFGVSQCR
jgi:hypothetical protein